MPNFDFTKWQSFTTPKFNIAVDGGGIFKQYIFTQRTIQQTTGAQVRFRILV